MPDVDPRLEWLAGVVFGADDVRVVFDGRVPPGFRVAESYAVVPGLSRARFLVPLASRRAATASLRRYNALRSPRVRAGREAVSLLMRTGLGRGVFRDRLHVCVPSGVVGDDLANRLLSHHLELVLGRPVACAFGVGRQGPNRKPVAQLFSRAGRPVAYVKLAWNPFTERMVRNEAARLEALAETTRETLWAPEVLHEGSWKGHALSAVSPLPGRARRTRPARVPPPVGVTRAVAGEPSRAPLASSGWISELRHRLAALPPEAAGPGERALSSIERAYGRASMPCGGWHGDWVPWNLAAWRGRVVAWDWEHGGDSAPLGFDLVHFHAQVAFVRDRLELGRALSWARHAATPSLRALGLDHLAADLVPRLYVVELFVRYEEAAAGGAGRNPRLYPAILHEMEEAAGAR